MEQIERPSTVVIDRCLERWSRVAEFLLNRGIDGATAATIARSLEPDNQTNMCAGLSHMVYHGRCSRYGFTAIKFHGASKGRWLFVSLEHAQASRARLRCCVSCRVEQKITEFAILTGGDEISTVCLSCTSSAKRAHAERVRRRTLVHRVSQGEGSRGAEEYTRPRPQIRYCDQCYGIPDRRPSSGQPCACGGVWAPDDPPKVYDRRDWSMVVDP